MLKIPYGKSDFKTIVEEEYFYQDRTNYIKTLEDWSSTYLVYLRPRRFGKSLLISTLHYYYGMEYQKEFNTLFGHTFIGKNPTRRANKYAILRFDFSGINTETEQKTHDGFLSNVLKGCENFINTYINFFSNEQKKEILSQKEPNEMIKSLLHRVQLQRSEQKVYILIDEYDCVANPPITFNSAYFAHQISQNAYIRTFYEVLKIYTKTGLVERTFITGVSIETANRVRSGFDIASDISLSPTFHKMMGFEEAEIQAILANLELPQTEIVSTLEHMSCWHDNYLFSDRNEAKLYNPTNVCYFANEYQMRLNSTHGQI